MLLESERSRRWRTPSLSRALIAFEAAKRNQGGLSSPALRPYGQANPLWGDLVNDILVLDYCQQKYSVVDFAAIYSSYLNVEYEAAQRLTIMTQPKGWKVTAPAQFQNMIQDFVAADWYEWVATRFPSILETALKRMSEQRTGTSILQTVGTGFKNAVAARGASVPEAETVYRNLRPHCTPLSMRKFKLHQSQK